MSHLFLLFLCNSPRNASWHSSQWVKSRNQNQSWNGFFGSITVIGLFAFSVWCVILRSYTLQSVGITLFASLNPKCQITRAASPVRSQWRGPKTVTAGNKNTQGRMASTFYLNLNIDFLPLRRVVSKTVTQDKTKSRHKSSNKKLSHLQTG